MLLLLQAVAQLPPINVTVQSPPGMAEWEKTLLAAGTGALFGILSSIAMEYVKPWIASRSSKNTVKTELAEELIENLDRLRSVVSICNDAAEKDDRAKMAAKEAVQWFLEPFPLTGSRPLLMITRVLSTDSMESGP